MPSRELDQPRAGRATIVLVDDDVHLLRSMERLLQDSFDVIACEFAGHALDEVQRGGVSVVLSDIAMPGMDGIDLLRAIRNRDPDLPVILITGAPTPRHGDTKSRAFGSSGIGSQSTTSGRAMRA
jgi:DNA-binding NtrC family response regulator